MPPGVLPSHTVTIAGKGTEHPSKLPGSIRVVAVQLAHPRFERRGECMNRHSSPALCIVRAPVLEKTSIANLYHGSICFRSQDCPVHANTQCFGAEITCPMPRKKY